MLEFIQLLKQRYQMVLSAMDSRNPLFSEYQHRIEQLLYSEAFIRKGQLLDATPDFPVQIAVIGPTQAGKSSVVNTLLNGQQAGVSPLAGYTVHPHGYCHAMTAASGDALQHYFGRFQCVPETALSRNRFDCYSLSDSHNSSSYLPPAIVWDTPDFDSIDAGDYREGVVRTIALADLVVLVVSKEKYADQSVWDVLKTIDAFKQPTLICLNKIDPDNETILRQSLSQRWQQYQDPVPTIVSLQFQTTGSLPTWPVSQTHVIFQLLAKRKASQHAANQLRLIQHYWPQWMAPIHAEHQAQRHWQDLVNQVLAQATQHYQRDYLNHPHHYETFQQALLNLLRLLELPAIAKAMSKTRRVMTWTFRQLMSFGKLTNQHNSSQELTVLLQIGEHVLIQLADQLAEKAETDAEPRVWWKEIAVALRQNRQNLLIDFQRAADNYQLHFEQNIEAAAHRLYYKLQEQPLTLNSLRATRATADAAAMILAIQTGGIGVHDLLLTPMMLSITSLMAESAMGSYMHKVETELKHQQLKTVQQQVFDQALRSTLHQLRISEAECAAIETQLHETKHGLRLL